MLSKLRSKNSFPLSFPLRFLLLTPPPISASSNFLGKGGGGKEEGGKEKEHGRAGGEKGKKVKLCFPFYTSLSTTLGKRVFLFDIFLATVPAVPQLHSRFLFETSFFRP